MGRKTTTKVTMAVSFVLPEGVNMKDAQECVRHAIKQSKTTIEIMKYLDIETLRVAFLKKEVTYA